MSDVFSVILNNNELIRLFRFVPKNDLIKYLRMKEYKEKYAKSYSGRIEKVSDIIIANFFHNEVFGKHNKEICDHYNKIFNIVKEKFEDDVKEISQNYLEVINSANIYRFDEIIHELITKQYDLEILPILFKLINVNLSDAFLYVINNISKHKQEVSNIIIHQNEAEKNEIIKGIEKSCETKINKMNKRHKQELEVLELKYREEIEQASQLVLDLKNKNEQEIKNYEKQVSALKVIIESLNHSVNKLSKRIKDAEEIVLSQSELLIQREQFILELQKKGDIYERLLELKVINKDMLINVVNEMEFNNESLKDNFKKFIDKLPENEEDRNIELIDEWQKWINEESNCIKNILTKSISKGEIENEDMAILDEISYVVQFRYLLIRLIMALAYKYLSSECWQEVFE